MRVKSVLLIGVAVTALSLAACTSEGTSPPSAAGSGAPSGNPSSAASPTGGSATVSGRDACLLGGWKVDVDDMAKQAAEKVGRGATGKGSGTITLNFGDKMTINYANATLNIKAPVSE